MYVNLYDCQEFVVGARNIGEFWCSATMCCALAQGIFLPSLSHAGDLYPACGVRSAGLLSISRGWRFLQLGHKSEINEAGSSGGWNPAQ